MKALIQKENFNPLSQRLIDVCHELESINHLYKAQMLEDPSFVGEAAIQYQNVLHQLLNEQNKMIEYYKELAKMIKEIEQDYSSQEEYLLSRLNNL